MYLDRDAVLDEESDLDVHGVEVLLQVLVLPDQLCYVACKVCISVINTDMFKNICNRLREFARNGTQATQKKLLSGPKNAELLTIMIAPTIFYSIVVNNRFQSIFSSMDHNSMMVT